MGDIRGVVTGITFGVVGNSLRSREITDSLGLTPTRAFEKGDTYLGKQKVAGTIQEIERKRPRGVWHFCTSEFVTSDAIEDHAVFLLEKLEPVAATISGLIGNPCFFVKLSIWHVGSGGFGLPGGLVARLAALCEEFAITCWEAEEDGVKTE